MGVVESVGLDSSKEVETVFPGILEIVGSAAGEKVQALVRGKVAGNLFNAVALGGVGIENRRGGIGQVTEGHHTGRLALGMEIVT